MIEPPLKWSHPIFRKRGTINGHQSEPAFFRHFTLNLTLYPTHCSPKSEPWRPQQANSCVTACQTAHVYIDAQACGRVAESAGMVNQRGDKRGTNSINNNYHVDIKYLCDGLWCPHTDIRSSPFSKGSLRSTFRRVSHGLNRGVY